MERFGITEGSAADDVLLRHECKTIQQNKRGLWHILL